MSAGGRRADWCYHSLPMTAKTTSLGLLVERVAAELGAPLEAPARDALLVWLDVVQDWNTRMDLTAARSPEQLADVMVADALVLARRVPQAARVVDVGTGAGAPGLALALARPDLRVTLVEPMAKRVAFLRAALEAVGRADVAVERARGEAVTGRGGWDVAVSRATLPPPQWLEVAVTLASPGGSAWVLLARGEPPTHPRARLDEDVAYTLPLTGATRRAVRYVVGR